MPLNKLSLPVTKVDDTDPGTVAAVTAAEGTIAIATGGLYKIAAMGTSLLWKIGAVGVTAATGSYLADGDQELILIPEGGDTLRFIRSANATVNGEINLVVANLFKIPGVEPRNYN